MLKTRIKAGGIANLTDARYFAAWDVEWLSFALDEGGEGISPSELVAIRDWVEGPRIMAEFGLVEAAYLQQIVELTGIEAAQVGPFFPLQDLSALSNCLIFQEVIAEPGQEPEALEAFLQERAERVDFFVLDLSRNGLAWEQIREGEPFSADFLQHLCRTYAPYLDIPVQPKHLSDMLQHVQPYGLNLKGGAEEKVGVKSFDDLDALLEELSSSDE